MSKVPVVGKGGGQNGKVLEVVSISVATANAIDLDFGLSRLDPARVYSFDLSFVGGEILVGNTYVPKYIYAYGRLVYYTSGFPTRSEWIVSGCVVANSHRFSGCDGESRLWGGSVSRPNAILRVRDPGENNWIGGQGEVPAIFSHIRDMEVQK